MSSSNDYEPVIGLEIHAELSTASKIFCGCSTQFGADPNTQVCPVCLGLPGILPVLNEEVLHYAMRAAIALNCSIQPYFKFDRKNYFYPDLPKGFQISEYEKPLALGGYVEIESEGGSRKIGITRVHIEEDAGKSIHEENGHNHGDKSYVDYNRTGVPLLEIVTEPDLRDQEETREVMLKIRDILRYLDISNCDMEKGNLRFDTNVSLRPVGSDELGERAEIKNLNSFRFVLKTIEYEMDRQSKMLRKGLKIERETRLFDSDRGITLPMRLKEDANDYRYFPEPDLPPVIVSQDWIERVKDSLPELPDAKRERFVKEYKIPAYDAGVLTSSPDLADYYEECVGLHPDPKAISNWIMGDLLGAMKSSGVELEGVKVHPSQLARMMKLIDDKTINITIGKTVFAEMFETGADPEKIIEKKGLAQISDEGQLAEVAKKVLADNPDIVISYKGGKTKVIGFLLGQVMKATGGKANPQLANKMLIDLLNEVGE